MGTYSIFYALFYAIPEWQNVLNTRILSYQLNNEFSFSYLRFLKF